MIDRGFQPPEKRIKTLGNESVHGLPLDWPEKKRAILSRPTAHPKTPLATQNVHGLPTTWDELDLSE